MERPKIPFGNYSRIYFTCCDALPAFPCDSNFEQSSLVVDATQLLNVRISQNPPASVADQSGQSGQEDEDYGRFVASTLAGIGEKKKRKVMLDFHRILVEAMHD
uniref:Uncharacterized protein n=1 Tax=Plectus sambesii TaxID=2011161 RepID=A0A914UYQ0_9BILA